MSSPADVDKVLGVLSRISCLLTDASSAGNLRDATRRCSESLADIKALTALLRRILHYFLLNLEAFRFLEVISLSSNS